MTSKATPNRIVATTTLAIERVRWTKLESRMTDGMMIIDMRCPPKALPPRSPRMTSTRVTEDRDKARVAGIITSIR